MLALLLLTSCTNDGKSFNATKWHVAICPVDGVHCKVSDMLFDNKEDCEQFAKDADNAQTKVNRVCMRAKSWLGD
jgi:hypothetical protein